MPKRVIVLSGAVGSGKTSLAENLRTHFAGEIVKTREMIRLLLPTVENNRSSLQTAGENLDRKTAGSWVVESLRGMHPSWFSDAAPNLVVIDSVRILGQIDTLRKTFGNEVIHIHLTASAEELTRRFSVRVSTIREATSYRTVRKNLTEKKIEELSRKADIVIDTDRNTANDVLVRAAGRIGLLATLNSPLVDIVVGGQYGSEGKGNIVSYIAPEYSVLLRVGSVNAGHKVFWDPIYAFKQLPSGTLHNERAHIVLGPGTQIRMDVLLKEIGECKLDYHRLSIDPQAMIIEKIDQIKEKELVDSIGSTGQGVGHAAMRRIMRMTDGSVRLVKNINELKPYIRPTAEILERAYQRGEKILLEGTQGTSLSLYHGYYPHVTSRDTTAAGCMAEAGISPKMVRKVVMVCRSYPIRVESPQKRGKTSGPMSAEISLKEVARRSGISLKELEKTEKTTTTDRKRRIAEFNWEQLRKSSLLNSPTDIAVTFVDYINAGNRDARRFEQLDEPTINFIEEVERVATAPVSLISTRFHWRCIIDRRRW